MLINLEKQNLILDINKDYLKYVYGKINKNNDDYEDINNLFTTIVPYSLIE